MSSYLIHWGIKGQKWGIRRFQNEDGTLTPEGIRRYRDLSDKEKKEAQESNLKLLKKDPNSYGWNNYARTVSDLQVENHQYVSDNPFDTRLSDEAENYIRNRRANLKEAMKNQPKYTGGSNKDFREKWDSWAKDVAKKYNDQHSEEYKLAFSTSKNKIVNAANNSRDLVDKLFGENANKQVSSIGIKGNETIKDWILKNYGSTALNARIDISKTGKELDKEIDKYLEDSFRINYD